MNAYFGNKPIFGSGITVEDYDTDDGWHVRKYSDGYVEIDGTFSHTIHSTDWGEWGNIYSVGLSKVPTYFYPIPLTVIYGETFDVAYPVSGAIAIIYGHRESNNQTKHYGFIRGTTLAYNITVIMHYHVTGRWM